LSGPLRSRIEVIKLRGYTEEEKVAIAKLIIERYFTDDVEGKLDQKLLEIDDQALKTLIGKTKEEGVRQLKRGIGKIIDYCIDI